MKCYEINLCNMITTNWYRSSTWTCSGYAEFVYIICSLFNDAISNSDSMASKGSMIK